MAQFSIPKPISLDSEGVVFFIRHGQCKSNVTWPIENYHDDIDVLTELGINQALSCAKYLDSRFSQFEFKIITSELKRARQTGETLLKRAKGSIVFTDKRINEYSNKDEDINKFHARIDSFLDDLNNLTLQDHERVLIVTHGFVLENLVCKALDAKINGIDKGGYGGQKGICTHSNCGLSAFYRKELLLWNFNAA